MKKLLALILVLSILFTFAACSKKTSETDVDDVVVDTEDIGSSAQSDAQEELVEDEATESSAQKEEIKQEQDNKKEPADKEPETQKNEDNKTEIENPSSSSKPQQEESQPAENPQPQNPSTQKEEPKPKPTSKPATKPTQNSENKPALQPENKPSSQPETKPVEPASSTLGNILLKDFNSKAGSGMSALAIAESIVTGPAIAFSGAAMPVEEGLLSGFDNYEVNGFKAGAMFAPMIGSIPFVGYVFELDNSTDASSFISNLRKNANLRWNICSEAEEMVTGSKGNLVFFVMCPKSLEE